MGGAWVSTIQKRAYNLCQQFGLELIPQYEDGNTIMQVGDTNKHLSNISEIEADANQDMSKYISHFEILAKSLDLTSTLTKELDKISVLCCVVSYVVYIQNILPFIKI